MNRINITVLPAVERSTSRIIRINPDTHEKLLELADRMEMGVSRIADYLLNEAMNSVELTVLTHEPRTIRERLESIREAEQRNAVHEAEWKEANNNVEERHNADNKAE